MSISIFLIKKLELYPLLYYAVEEGAKCASLGYYSSGIIVLSQLLNLLNEKTPAKRHEIAHEILKLQPNKSDYETILEDFNKAALEKQNQEMSRYKNLDDYKKAVDDAMEVLRKRH